MPYDHGECRAVSHVAFERLKRRATAIPRLAVAGEFSSGKSTLLNLLLGQEVLPTRATATALPSVWISYGKKQAFYVDAAGDRHPLPPEGMEAVPNDSRFIRLYMTAEFLKDCEVIDLSGLADPERPDGMAQEMLSYASFAIWCTPATQAWRQSERAAWLTVPARIRTNSVLAVTRIDKLNTEQESRRVIRRLEHETEGLFAACTPISALLAQRAVVTNDEQDWLTSGIDDLMDLLSRQIERIQQTRTGLLDRYTPTGATAIPADEAPLDQWDDIHTAQAPVRPEPELDHEVIGFGSQQEGIAMPHAVPPLFKPTTLILENKYVRPAQLVEGPQIATDDACPGKEQENVDIDVIAEILTRSANDIAPPVETRHAETNSPVTGASHHQAGDMISDIEAAMQRVLASYFGGSAATSSIVCEASQLPQSGDKCVSREMLIWRDIVAKSSISAEQTQIVVMIDQLVTRIFAERRD